VITFPATRKGRWLIILFWIALMAIISPYASKVGDLQDNDTAAFLPESAESLQVAQLQSRFDTSETMTAIIVYHRDGGLMPDDFATIEGDIARLGTAFPSDAPIPLIPSDDGKAVMVPIELPEEFDDAGVKLLKEQLSRDIDGLDVKVTGPAGFMADFAEVFDGIDGTLLLTTALVVAVLLLITYRSPILWILPLLTVGLADQLALAGSWVFGKHLGVNINGQNIGILPVLVFGVGTDYALLILARYREELRRFESHLDALRASIRQAAPAILASASTCILGLICLLLADLNSNKSLGPIGAVGIASALFGMLTFLVAILAIIGRKVFWPFVPKVGAVEEHNPENNLWGRIGRWISINPRRVWISTALFLGILALGVVQADTTLSTEESFRTRPESIEGQALLAESFPAGSGAPTIVVANTNAATEVEQALIATEGVVDVAVSGADDELTRWSVTLAAEPASNEAFTLIDRLRDNVHPIAGADAMVGGSDAESRDVARASVRDALVVMPAVLIVVFLILCWLLRSVLAPAMLIATVVLSFLASLGASILVFDHLFGFGGLDPSIPLLGFVFLVALGIDYNIFLMSRVHEEAAVIGTRKGMLRALAVTGGVITSAGIVLAATFSVLGVLPLVFMIELGFLVAFGVLLDTFIVRSILVPALTFDIGSRIWWPSKLTKTSAD
jgi:RND superfamily putative drug exporter